jgi:hypothetical protein
LSRIKERNQRAVIWGSGSKAVAFLTSLGVRDEVEYVVDINPYKHGMFMPRTGHEIVAPSLLKRHRPDVAIVMNPVYCDEIQHDLAEMDLRTELIAV